MRRRISFYNSSARAAIPTDYYRDVGSPQYFQMIDKGSWYLLSPCQQCLDKKTCLPVSFIKIKSKKREYLQYVLYIPVEFAGGKKQGRLIEDYVDWLPINNSLCGKIRKLTPGRRTTKKAER